MNLRDEARQRFAQTWQSPSGVTGWFAEVNNRPLGIRYMVTALSFFAAGVVLAIFIRTQLAVPHNTFLGPDAYNGVFTMHGSTMLYLFAVPFVEGLGLYLVPMMIGSRDMAFPRLTNFGYWMYLFGGLTMYASFIAGQVPDSGWTAYTPLSGPMFSGPGMDYWLLGLSMVEIAGISAAVEIVVTILKLRAPGMSVRHIPLLVWSYLVAGLMILFAFTPLLLATLLLEMDRAFGFQFFNPHRGGSSLLWQHLFWWFGHPEVYIIFLPATGVISAIIPAFARRRIVAYPLIIAAVVITGFVSFGLWTHHMFTAGLPDLPMLFFTAASFMIALAAGTQVFAWIATLWGSRPRYSVQMLYILGFFIIFVNGGMTGVMVATMPFDWQVHDTNFVVAHFHHVLIGGAVLPFLAGLHHWLPKLSGRMFSERWGRIGFGLVFLGFNITFVPMYVIGLFGMRRRIYTYPEGLGVDTLNLISSVGAYLLALGFAAALLNLLWNSRRGAPAGDNPWNDGSLEWSTSSPPPQSGFDQPPVVRDLYPQWQPAATADRPPDPYTARLTTVTAALNRRPTAWRATLVTDTTNAHPQVLQHLPGPTRFPFYVAAVMWLAAFAFLFKSYVIAGLAAVISAVMIGRWVCREPDFAPDEMRELSAELPLPLIGSGRQSTAWWGMVGLLAILFTVLGALLFTYFYLRLYSGAWPQAGLPLPELPLSMLACGLLAAAGAGQGFNSWAWRRDRRAWLVAGMSATILIGLGFIGAALALLLSAPFLPTANAYASAVFTIQGFVLLIALTGLAMQTGTLLRVHRLKEPLAAPRLMLWLQNTELFWFFVVGAGLAGLLTIFVTPHVL